MASTSAVSMAMPITSASNKGLPSSSSVFLKPLPVRPSKTVVRANSSKTSSSLQISASLKEKMIAGLTAGALSAMVVIPEAEAASGGLSPSLKNFLLSIAAGGTVLTAILGAVIGVSNFDPVKRS